MAGVPAVTISGVSTTSTTVADGLNGTPTISVSLPPSTTSVEHVTVTNGTPSPAIVQNTVTGVDTPTATSNLPGGIVKSRGTAAYSGKLAALIAFGAMVGAVLAL